MSERKENIKARLNTTRAFLDQVLDQVGERWQQQIYSDGLAWNVRQIVVHLADAERGHYNQVTNIAEGVNIIPEDFDIERYNRRTTEKFAEKTAQQARDELTAQRAQLIAWLDALDDAKLDREGRHASLQTMTVLQILKLMAAHEQGHAQDIAAALAIPTV